MVIGSLEVDYRILDDNAALLTIANHHLNTSLKNIEYNQPIHAKRHKTKTKFFIANDEDENDKLFSFCFYDVCDNVLALAWELNPKDKKLVFRFGELYHEVDSKLKKRKIYMFEETRDNFVEDEENEE